MDFDVLVRGGDVVDGSGSPPARLDVGIAGGRVAAVAPLRGAGAAQVIDARGLAVAPGFIDVHVHSELARLGGPDQLAGVLDGVTTELMSPDGFGWAPLEAGRLRQVRDYLQAFYGDPDLRWDWCSVSGYLSLFPGRIPGNLVPQAPHQALRAAAMGWEPGPPTPEQLATMRAGLVEWLDAGAVGLAAGLEYQPGALADTGELVELCRVVAAADGVYATHQRGYWGRLRRGCEETIRIARESGVRVHVSHLPVDETAAGLLDDAVASGVDATFDMYPYSAACTHLLMMLPEWAQRGGVEASLRHLSDPASRARLRAETAARLAERGPVTLSHVEGGEALEGRSLGELARERGQADVDLLLDLLAAHAGRALAVYHWPAGIDADGILRRTLRHPLFLGGSDGIYLGSRPHPRGFGTFARIAGDQVRAGTLGLERAVHRVTGAPAERFRLRDRGLLRPGRAADVTVFDPAALADRGTWRDGRAAPAGIVHVLVNGEVVVAGGRPTGRLPGRIVRAFA
jgi:N-acyl-D-amino-acid deacylase